MCNYNTCKCIIVILEHTEILGLDKKCVNMVFIRDTLGK